MKEKDKAKELVERYKSHTAWWDYYWDVEIEDSDRIQKAKPMALVCVDEIIKVLNSGNLYMEHGKEDSNTYDTSPEYWETVKSEIEAL